jgi:hypothetical protein
VNAPYEPETTGEIEYVPDDHEIDLAMLANDLNEVLASDEYGFDVHDHTVAAALPAFLAALREHATDPVCANGCPYGPAGRHKMSCPEAKPARS